MIDKLKTFPACFLLLALVTYASAQQAEDDGEEPSLEERVTALERAVARLDTRLTARTTGFPARGPEGDRPLEQRVIELERSVLMLRADVQRIERTVTAAQRTAIDAQGAAARAERLTQNAANRAR